jgi:hypothetical protein
MNGDEGLLWSAQLAQRSVQLPSGAIRLRTSSTRSPVRTSGGRSGRGRPRRAGWNLGELGGRTALSDMAVGVLYNCAYSTTLDRNTTANRNGHAMPHTETAKRTPVRLPVIAPRCAPRTVRETSYRYKKNPTPPAPPGPARCRMPAHVPLASRGAPQRHIRISNRAPRSPPPHPDRERS